MMEMNNVWDANGVDVMEWNIVATYDNGGGVAVLDDEVRSMSIGGEVMEQWNRDIDFFILVWENNDGNRVVLVITTCKRWGQWIVDGDGNEVNGREMEMATTKKKNLAMMTNNLEVWKENGKKFI
jgi:hypothetical protein